MELIMSIGYGVVAILLVGIALGLFSKVFYKKAPPNVAMVITGPRGSRTVVG